MDISDASTFFDDDPVFDGYTGAYLFDGQVASFDDSHGDGSTSRRRVLSLGSGIAIPARRTISLYNEVWLVGSGSPDGFYGDVVRQHFDMRKSTDMLSLLTPGEVLSNAVGTQAWAHKLWFRDQTQSMDSPNLDTFWHIFVAPDEPAGKGTFFKDAEGRLYRTRNDYLPAEGLRVCEADTLIADALQSVSWNTGSYDPITDAVTPGTVQVNVIALETPKFYRFRHVSDASLQKGDLSVFVPTTVTPKQGDEFQMYGVLWQALSVQPEMDCWAVHVRRA